MMSELTFKERHKKPRPPPSSKPIDWPGHPTDEQKQLFGLSLRQLLLQRNIDYMDLAREFYGLDKTGTVKSSGPVREWAKGVSMPQRTNAEYIAQFFGVPLERLLEPDDTNVPFVSRRRSLNDPKNNGAQLPAVIKTPATPTPQKTETIAVTKKTPPNPARGTLVPLLEDIPLPEGASPLLIATQSVASNPECVEVKIIGTVRYDTAMSLMALLDPRHSGFKR